MEIRETQKTGLEGILCATETTKIMKYMINKSINLKVKEINYIGDLEHLVSSEYSFKLSKFKIITNKNETIYAYIKFIEKGTIKETIFYYWNLICEEKVLNVDTSMLKTYIRELNIEKYNKEILLEMQNKKLEKLENKLKLHFIELENYLNQRNEEIEYKEYFNKDLEFVIFIGTLVS